MKKYIQRAIQEIRRDFNQELRDRDIFGRLNFKKSQLLTLGTFLSLDEDEELFRFVEVNKYTRNFLSTINISTGLTIKSEPVYDPKEPREIDLIVVLQPRWRNVPHEGVRHRISQSLNQKGFPQDVEMFNYCERSFGINHENVDAIIGCLHYRADKRLHPRDKLELEVISEGG